MKHLDMVWKWGIDWDEWSLRIIAAYDSYNERMCRGYWHLTSVQLVLITKRHAVVAHDGRCWPLVSKVGVSSIHDFCLPLAFRGRFPVTWDSLLSVDSIWIWLMLLLFEPLDNCEFCWELFAFGVICPSADSSANDCAAETIFALNNCSARGEAFPLFDVALLVRGVFLEVLGDGCPWR